MSKASHYYNLYDLHRIEKVAQNLALDLFLSSELWFKHPTYRNGLL